MRRRWILAAFGVGFGVTVAASLRLPAHTPLPLTPANARHYAELARCMGWGDTLMPSNVRLGIAHRQRDLGRHTLGKYYPPRRTILLAPDLAHGHWSVLAHEWIHARIGDGKHADPMWSRAHDCHFLAPPTGA